MSVTTAPLFFFLFFTAFTQLDRRSHAVTLAFLTSELLHGSVSVYVYFSMDRHSQAVTLAFSLRQHNTTKSEK